MHQTGAIAAADPAKFTLQELLTREIPCDYFAQKQWNDGLEHPVIKAALEQQGIDPLETRVDLHPGQANGETVHQNPPTPENPNV
jgi:hypothetical protein